MTMTTNDDGGPSKSPSPPAPSLNEHLSFPSPEPDSSVPLSQPRQVLKDRLYVGNLHPSVDEYARRPFSLHHTNVLLQVLAPPDLLQVRQSHPSRLSLPQSWHHEGQTARLRIRRVWLQRRASSFLVPSLPQNHELTPGLLSMFFAVAPPILLLFYIQKITSVAYQTRGGALFLILECVEYCAHVLMHA